MKGIVNTYLNLRVGSPSVNAENPSYYEPGEEVEVVDTVVGDSYKDNNVWFQLENKGYIWTGGISNITTQYDYYLAINEIRNLKVDGEGIEVALIDSGLLDKENLNFKENINLPLTKKFLDETKLYANYEDKADHGTRVASIISCNAPGTNISLAPKARLTICKITENKYQIYSSKLKSALKWCIDQDQIHIINCSLSLVKTDRELDELIKQAGERNKLIVSAGEYNKSGKVEYLARHSKVMGVGAVDKFDFRSHIDVNVKDVNFFTLGKHIDVLTKEGDLVTDSGSSFSSAYFTGFAALAFSAYKKKHGSLPKNTFEWISHLSRETARLKNDDRYSNGIVDPLAAIKKLV